MTLAIFDLDNTLLAGDSDHLWGEYLIERGVLDGARHAAANQRFHEQYMAGELDIHEFLGFALKPLADNRPSDLRVWRTAFVREKIEPIALTAARHLVEAHRAKGDTLLIITATNRFVTEPIADLFGIANLLATEPEIRAGRYTGRYIGLPTYREGKIAALRQWCRDRGLRSRTTFYSDSRNDLPLMREVDMPVAVDPDPTLDEAARAAGWPRLTLRAGPVPAAIPA